MKILEFKALYITTAASLLIGSALLILPKFFLFAETERVKTEIPLIEESNKMMIHIPIETDLNSWIEENLEESIDFFTEQVTNDPQISTVIVKNSLKNDIPVNLSFSVAYKESKFKKDAYNDNGKSRDRGLFQLNDSYRQSWEIEDFYNIDKNSYEGIRYLKEMIELNENDVKKALYCYNAGPTKVRKYGLIPEKTKTYADEILEMERHLNSQLIKRIMN